MKKYPISGLNIWWNPQSFHTLLGNWSVKTSLVWCNMLPLAHEVCQRSLTLVFKKRAWLSLRCVTWVFFLNRLSFSSVILRSLCFFFFEMRISSLLAMKIIRILFAYCKKRLVCSNFKSGYYWHWFKHFNHYQD
jgi:hypothetical protein